MDYILNKWFLSSQNEWIDISPLIEAIFDILKLNVLTNVDIEASHTHNIV